MLENESGLLNISKMHCRKKMMLFRDFEIFEIFRHSDTFFDYINLTIYANINTTSHSTYIHTNKKIFLYIQIKIFEYIFLIKIKYLFIE